MQRLHPNHLVRAVALSLTLLATGVLLAPPAGAQGTRYAQAELADILLTDGLTRERLVGLYRSLTLAQFQPPACVADQEMFTDVPATSSFCPWIEELARRGITTGCTATEYCPGNPVTRAQMAIFLVRSMEACPTLDPTDEMIRVGGVCIDKYEASIWDAPVGGNLIPNNQPIPCDSNGQNCDNIYARSVAGVEPRRFITWFQAQQALANSGKRLPTSAEWQMAVAGTPDPGTDDDATDCNISFDSGQDPVDTGSRSNCVSAWGAFDMVGNVWEWVADWDEDAAGCAVWSATFGDDVTCVGRGDGDSTTRFPGALIRGGHFFSGSSAGPFAVDGVNRPSDSVSGIGFRGAR